MSDPSPVFVDVTGVAGPTGVFTFKRAVQQAHWFVGKLVGSVPAANTSAAWSVTASGRPLDFGVGTPVSIGPLLVQPGEVVTVIVSGLAANTLVNAGFVGVAEDDPGRAANRYTPSANPINTQVLPLIFAALQLVGLEDPAGTQSAGSGTGSGNVLPPGAPTGLDVYSNGLIFSRRTSAPADWEVATAGAPINTTVANGGSATIIPSPGVNHRLIIHSFVLATFGNAPAVTNASGALQDASATVILTRWGQRTGVQAVLPSKGPVKLPVNQALVLTNDDVATSLFLTGGVLYTVSASG